MADGVASWKAHTWHPASSAPSHPPHHTWRRVALLHLHGNAEVPQDVEMESCSAICRQHVGKRQKGDVAARWNMGSWRMTFEIRGGKVEIENMSAKDSSKTHSIFLEFPCQYCCYLSRRGRVICSSGYADTHM